MANSGVGRACQLDVSAVVPGPNVRVSDTVLPWTMDAKAAVLLRQVRDFVSSLPSGTFPGTAAAAASLIEALTTEFETGRKARHGTLQTRRQLQKQSQKLKQKIEKLNGELAVARSDKLAGRVTDMWFLRCAFADPKVALQSLALWCETFYVQEQKAISRTYIATAKDAMCELVKQLNCEELAHLAATRDGTLFVRHIHDEALMKLRSYKPDAAVAGRIIRGKYSKVQNNVMEFFCGQHRLEYFTELQCLDRKDSQTIASAIISVLEGAVSALGLPDGRRAQSRRLVHCLIGDGISTNAKAARYVLAHFNRSLAAGPLQYRLVLVKCASHAANLVVQVGVTGSLIRDPINRCDLTAACSRWFKHILPSNMEEVHSSLHVWLQRNGSDILRRGIPQGMEDLYGPTLWSDRLLALLRGETGLDLEQQVRELYICIFQL